MIALQLQHNDLSDSVIFPPTQNQGLTFEPLAPFVAKGDSQWLNIVNRVIWATMYAVQIGIDKKAMSELTSLLAEPGPDYKGFLGVKDDGSPITDPLQGLNIDTDYAYNIISQVGNYEDIFKENLVVPYEKKHPGEQYPRKFNCIWNPLKQPTPPGEAQCRLVVPAR